ncbi:uncharacterized protein LOC123516886 [Portunus trituberculatus]|uniref:uncharacterized protein LOC123516886 n=1 Tax=Portunus trituberculatus TaxID=210409 RepID=UPI001E1D08DC|nr:uncharacterized protein LOC123516886 [Portunus trituberculatus]
MCCSKNSLREKSELERRAPRKRIRVGKASTRDRIDFNWLNSRRRLSRLKLKDGEDIAFLLNQPELLKLDKDLYTVRLGALLSGKADKTSDRARSSPVKPTNSPADSSIRPSEESCKTPDGSRQDFRSSKI